jgi:periplasmic mercuric ion binding protein
MKYLSVSLLVGLLTSGAAWAAEQQVRIAVGDLSCPSCAYIVSSAMSDVPTVEVIDFQVGEIWSEGTFTVTFDDSSATPDMIVEAVTGYGYPASIATAGGS